MDHEPSLSSDTPASPAGMHLSRLIARQQLTSLFQPIVALHTGEPYGYEVLSRGTPPLQSPERMFQLAKELGRSWDLERACRFEALRRIAELAAEPEPLPRFFLNVSPDIFFDRRFAEGFTRRLLRTHGIDQHHIVFELTEKESIVDQRNFERVLRHYRRQGFRIALDDFGAGYSGLKTLVACTPQFLKLDISIVRGIDTSPFQQHLVRSLLQFADNVRMCVIAEGIERYQELRTLVRLGVPLGQGFLLARPASQPRPLHPRMRWMLQRIAAEEPDHGPTRTLP